MKITYIRLENFSQIFTAMGKRILEIDFSKCRNNIILFVGKNGSGKTSVLSALHPFAYPGNMDVRSGSNMITEGENGYKEIHIDFDGVSYVIKHHYNRSSSGAITMKSYISRDGEELNPNGNVTSFNELVYGELSLQQDYLKLLRLGSNVTNIIQMKAAERKTFTSDLLTDIGVYTDLYKKITEDSRVLKRLIMAVASKIERTNVSDEEELKRSIEFIKNNIALLTEDKGELQTKKGSIDGSIATLIPEGLDVFRDNMQSLQSECLVKEKEMNNLMRKLSDIPVVIIGDVDEYYNILSRELVELNGKENSAKNMIESLSGVLNSYYNERDDIDKQLATVTSDDSYNETENVVIRLRHDVSTMKKRFEKKKPVVTRDNMFTIINMMAEIDRIVSETYGFGMGAVKYCIKLMRDDVDVEKYVSKEISRVDSSIININSDFRSNMLPNDCIVLFRPSECSINDCPYLSLYNTFFNNDKENSDDSIVSLTDEKEFLNNVIHVYTNMKYIRRLLQTNAQIIQKLSMKQLTFEYMVSAIESDSPVYDERIFTSIISEIEEYDNYQMKQSDLKDMEIKLSSMRGNSEMLNSLRKRLDSVNDEINKILSDINTNKTNLENFQLLRQRKEETLSNVSDYLTIYKEVIDIRDAMDTIYEKLYSKKETLEKVKGYVDTMSDITNQMNDITSRINSFNNELFKKTYTLTEYTNLIAEQRVLSDKYDEIEVIKESLSPTKGIPLLFIQLYFKNIKSFVNKLLESVYDDFEIEDFDISGTEFNIPYNKNGIRVSDVVYASQGETSFLSLALSFALINNSIKDYNILLLDEIDSTLDTRNRSMFLNILNQQIDMIHAEQVFLITHNNMFDSYPVDIVMTSDTSLDNYTNANIIYKV